MKKITNHLNVVLAISFSFLVCFFGLFSLGNAACGEDFRLSSRHFAVVVGDDGIVQAALDLRDGSNKLAEKNWDKRFCVLFPQKGGSAVYPAHAELRENQIFVDFPNGTQVVLNYVPFNDYFTLEVASVTLPEGESCYKLEFGRVFTALDYTIPDPFGVSALILTIQTDVLEYPGQAQRLGGRCFSEIGCVGAKIALVGVPEPEMRRIMKDVAVQILEKSKTDEEYRKSAPPVNLAGGGFARDIPKNFGSYIITSSAIQAEDVPAWAEHLAQFGVDHIDFHQGNPFRTGDFVFNQTAYPNGAADFRKMTSEMKQHGMIAGLHTYAEFFLGSSKYLTPVPHEDLDVFETFTLASDLDEKSTKFNVDESTENVSTICGYLIRNSLFLKIDSEIISFKAVGPDGFTQCTRGALGTQVSVHTKGAKVQHLSQFFSAYFAPNPKSGLFLEIARNTAKAYDEGGFSTIYLDALDGTNALLENKELTWYYDALFVREILNHITTEAPLLEYSTMHPSLWAARSRMGAWDSPARGYTAFFDSHFSSNKQSALKCYLPAQMGWFAVCPTRGKDDALAFQNRTLFREEVEYLGSKSLAYDSGLSYLDISLGTLPPAAVSNGKILKTFDTLRRKHYFGPAICERVQEPGKHFHLQKNGDSYALVPAEYTTFRPEITAETSEAHCVLTNQFFAQKPYIRLENMYAVEDSYDDSEAVELVPFDRTLAAAALTTRKFEEPFLNIHDRLGMGMWVFGDGKGQILNVRVESPFFRNSGSTDHYARLDHSGWKYIEFAEAQSGEFPQYHWPAGKGGVYAEFRQRIFYDTVSEINVMVAGPTEGLRFGTLKALPIHETVLRNPSIEVSGKKITFLGEIPSGCYAEFLPDEDPNASSIPILDPCGNEVGRLTLDGEVPEIPSGAADVTLQGDSPRTRWTFGLFSEPLKE